MRIEEEYAKVQSGEITLGEVATEFDALNYAQAVYISNLDSEEKYQSLWSIIYDDTEPPEFIDAVDFLGSMTELELIEYQEYLDMCRPSAIMGHK